MSLALPCPMCNGEGRTQTQSGGWYSPQYIERECSTCEGSGERGCDGFSKTQTSWSNNVSRNFRCTSPAEKIIGDFDGEFIDEAYCADCYRDWMLSAVGEDYAEAAE